MDNYNNLDYKLVIVTKVIIKTILSPLERLKIIL